MPNAIRSSSRTFMLRVACGAVIAVAAVTGAAALMAAAVPGADSATEPTVLATATPTQTPLDGVSLSSLLTLPDESLVDGVEVGAFVRFTQAAAAVPVGPPPAAPIEAPVPARDAAPPPAPTATLARPAPLVPTSTPPPPPPPPPPPASSALNTAPMDGYAQALFDATNRRRQANGLAALRANANLVGIARIRSQDMAQYNYFAHTSPVSGDTAFSLMDIYGVPYGWAGENLAKNNYSQAETVAVADQALWDSPSHRENIMNPNFTDVGIALAIDASGMNYFTILFTGP